MATMTFQEPERFYIVRAALMLLTSIATFVIFCCLLYWARGRKDPARKFLSFIKFSAVFFLLYSFINFCSFVFKLAFTRLAEATADQNTGSNTNLFTIFAVLLQAQIELAAFYRFADSISLVFVFLSLIFLSMGIHLAHTGEREKHTKMIHRISAGIAVLLAGLAAAQLGIRIKVYIEFYFQDYYQFTSAPSPSTLRLYSAARQLDFAFILLSLMLSMAMIARAVQIRRLVSASKTLHVATVYLLVSCGLWFFRSVFEIAHQIKYINIQDVLGDPPWDNYMDILIVVFHTWPTFITIILMFSLGIKSEDGVWSAEHPSSMSYNPDGSQDIPLESLADTPPRYSPRVSSSTPRTRNETSLEEGWEPSPVSTAAHPVPLNQSSPANPDGIERVPVPPVQQDVSLDGHEVDSARMSESYNTGLALTSDGFNSGMPIGTNTEAAAGGPSAPPPVATSDNMKGDALISDGYSPASPPAHDEAMGLNHQADGRQPPTPLPYPEKN